MSTTNDEAAINNTTTAEDGGNPLVDGIFMMHYIYKKLVEKYGKDDADWWLIEIGHLAAMDDKQFENELERFSPWHRCKAETHDGKLEVCDVTPRTDFYLFFDKENTDKLQKLLGGNIANNLHKYFSSNRPLKALREYCDANGVEYRSDSWTSGDDL